ncbi:MAG: hypothetical protein JRI25_27855, partial [Deltaproteobacteria bacterium]|nr:hypothetical protein [Deltaproteobacteria bacterium]
FRPGEYHGNAVCGMCHPMELDSWQLTRHSVAWHSLVEGGTQTDPECTSCHVTGANVPGGWDGDPSAHLVNVGCEACHGPGGPHDGVLTDATESCSGCHDPKHAIAFSYAKGLPHIDHFRSNGMDDQTWYERRRKLVDGTLPHDLLAFDEGAQVGAAACASCHEAQHTAWKGSAHASAMATLATEEARAHAADAPTNVACVRCHATADASGPPPSEMWPPRAGWATSKRWGTTARSACWRRCAPGAIPPSGTRTGTCRSGWSRCGTACLAPRPRRAIRSTRSNRDPGRADTPGRWPPRPGPTGPGCVPRARQRSC